MALAERHLREKLGDDISNHYVYGIVSYGDLMEGLSTESAELAGTWGLGKIIYFFDNNNISIDGFVNKVSDRILALNYGEIIATGPPEEIKANEKVRTAYMGE